MSFTRTTGLQAEVEYYAPTDIFDSADVPRFSSQRRSSGESRIEVLTRNRMALSETTTTSSRSRCGEKSTAPSRKPRDVERVYEVPQVVTGMSHCSLPFTYLAKTEEMEEDKRASGEHPPAPHSFPTTPAECDLPPKPLPRSMSLDLSRRKPYPEQFLRSVEDERLSFSPAAAPAKASAHSTAVSTQRVERKKFFPGCLLVFDRGIYEHWAVYIGNGQVVHLAGDEELKNRRQGPRAFVRSLFCGTDYLGVHLDELENIKGKSKITIGNDFDNQALGQPFPSQAVVERALLLVGQRGYHLKYNNCEHFATWARYGRSFSDQSKKWFRPLPSGCTAAEVRARVDRRTRHHISTERHAWLGVVTDPIAQKRFKWLGALPVSNSFRDVGLRVKKSVTGALREEEEEDGVKPKESPLGLLAASTYGWLATHREISADVGRPSAFYSYKTKIFQESDIESTLSTLMEFQQRCQSDGYAIRQICASGGTIAVVTGRLVVGEAVDDLFVAKSVQEFVKSAELSWRRSSPRYIYSCTYFNGYWLALTSNCVRLDDQKVFWAPAFSSVRENIAVLYDQGYIVSCIAAGSVWVVFMDKTTHTAQCRQEIFVTAPNEPFPGEHLQKMWGKGLSLTSATGN